MMVTGTRARRHRTTQHSQTNIRTRKSVYKYTKHYQKYRDYIDIKYFMHCTIIENAWVNLDK